MAIQNIESQVSSLNNMSLYQVTEIIHDETEVETCQAITLRNKKVIDMGIGEEYIEDPIETEGVKAQENNFITNEEVKNELVVAKTIFKQDGAQLYRHIRYEYSYDDQKRLTCKEASKWDGVKDEWVPYFKMTYQYGNDEITMSYARWNESHKAYDKDMKKSVYELNDENMPVAYKLYNQDAPKSELTLVSYNRTDYVANILAMAE